MKKIINQKGFFFGLDARIALSIFAVLTVIAGVLFHSALLRAKAVANIVEMNEIGKAFEQYVCDTGVFPPYENNVEVPQEGSQDITDTDANLKLPVINFDVESLIKNKSNLPNWKGPYLQGYSIETLFEKKLLSKGDNIYRGIGFAGKDFKECKADDCYLWVATAYPAGYRDVLFMIAKKLGVDIIDMVFSFKSGFEHATNVPRLVFVPIDMVISAQHMSTDTVKNLSNANIKGTMHSREPMGYISIYRYGTLNTKMLGIFEGGNYYDPYSPI